ncbi:MAG: sigma-54-dependent Fis family transcriptional regulator [Nitrospirae bacterium]|nr:sigma-54-dependent Fis family transcriptional regulator [Nitrospirota bacterium]
MNIKVLIVDDEEPVRRLLSKELSRKGFFTETASDGSEALKKLKKDAFDVVLLDIVMPGIDGIEFMKTIRNDPAAPSIIVLTGRATVETAVEAMKNGAFDYLTKPYKLEELNIIISRAYENRRLKVENLLLQEELTRRERPDEFISMSPQTKTILALIKKISPTDSTVLIQGESGTGKELVANYIWRNSKRSNKPFIALNCSTLAENLIESELFGHEKGAFTSAYKVKHGLVEAAHEGTLFLDEIGEMPISLQSKLLRFLDSGEFRRVGGNKNLKADVRIIAATNRNLEEEIQRGNFREDLYYRLNVISIIVPPLRERKEDIKPLADYFLKKYNNKFMKNIKGFDKGVLKIFEQYRWPGNVRELENIIERAVILCDTELISEEDIAIPVRLQDNHQQEALKLEDIEKEHILKVLKQTGGNQTRASKLLGIDRKTLYLKMKKYGIQN